MTQNIIHTSPPQENPIDAEKKFPLRKTDSTEFEDYVHDASQMPGGHAEAVVYPLTEKHVCDYLKIAHEKRAPVTVAGNHTGLVGGAVPFGGEVLATALFTKIFPKTSEDVIDVIEGHDELTHLPFLFYLKRTPSGEIRAVVPPGIRLNILQESAEERGFFYPPDPTESNAFLGANVSTNASGTRSFKYGATRAFVKELRVALSNGEMLQIQRNNILPDIQNTFRIILSNKQEIRLNIPSLKMPEHIKHNAGYFLKPGMDFIDLWIGSEGTLGVITQIELLMIPKPSSVLSGITFFDYDSQAVDFVQTVREHSKQTWQNCAAGIDMRALEYFDTHSLDLLRKNAKEITIPSHSKTAIYFEQESQKSIHRNALESLIAPLFKNAPLSPQDKSVLQQHPFSQTLLMLSEMNALNDLELAFPEEEKRLEQFRNFRHELPVQINDLIGHNIHTSDSTHLHKIATDTATPDESLRPMMNLFRETLEKSGIPYCTFGHIGNNHLHANLLPKNDRELQESLRIYLQLCRQVIALKGTVSAEHGIGKLKHSSLELLYNADDIAKMVAMKKALDPHYILGQGNIF